MTAWEKYVGKWPDSFQMTILAFAYEIQRQTTKNFSYEDNGSPAREQKQHL
jgi:hypothetical protein